MIKYHDDDGDNGHNNKNDGGGGDGNDGFPPQKNTDNEELYLDVT
jgi:hypothetical protein